MKKICTSVSMLLIIFGGNAWAADDTGYYYLDDVQIDGTSWSDSTVIETGQTYAVHVDMHYERVTFEPFQQIYSDNQTVNIEINGQNVFSASSSNPLNMTCDMVFGCDQVLYAEWDLSGDLMYDGQIDPVGVYAAFVTRSQNIYEEIFGDIGGDGFDPLFQVISQDVNMVNAVPEPSTLFLLGAGLFGIGVARRRKA